MFILFPERKLGSFIKGEKRSFCWILDFQNSKFQSNPKIRFSPWENMVVNDVDEGDNILLIVTLTLTFILQKNFLSN
jgi:hypothetical protein